MKTNEETAVLTLLRRQAPQSFEELMALSGLSASQVLLVAKWVGGLPAAGAWLPSWQVKHDPGATVV